jgi:hypothetical protein
VNTYCWALYARAIRSLDVLGPQESIREQVEKCRSARPGIPTSVDLPLSGECKRILEWAAEEAERLAHRHIGPEHLLLGLREKESLAGRILHEKGEVLEQLREHSGTISPRESGSPARFRRASPIKIHDFEWNGATIRERVHLLRQANWYWERKNWKPRDLAVREDGRLSFDVKLARNPKKFDLRRNGWKSDHCFVCEWTLFESEEQPDRGTVIPTAATGCAPSAMRNSFQVQTISAALTPG